VEVAGLEAAEWLKMYAHTHADGKRIEWPDGGCYLKQVQLLVDIWELIAGEIREYRREQRD